MLYFVSNIRYLNILIYNSVKITQFCLTVRDIACDTHGALPFILFYFISIINLERNTFIGNIWETIVVINFAIYVN